MSHHLDAPLARQDLRLDITDLYVFRGREGTVFVLNVNSSITGTHGTDTPQGFHPEAQYLIKLDLDGDAVEDLTYRFTFGEHKAPGSQSIEVRRLAGREAQDPNAPGTLIVRGETGASITGKGGLRCWSGRAADPFYIDATVLKALGAAFKQGARVDLSGWQPGAAANLFAGQTVSAIVLEIPDAELIWRLRETPGDVVDGNFTWRYLPERRINIWAATLLATDTGGWQPINRVGHPMMQPIFNPDDSEEANQYNITEPAEDMANYGERFARAVAAVVAAHRSAADPQTYGEAVAALLLPDMLPYRIGTLANYGFGGHNGRALTDNAPDVMFSLVTNSALTCGLSAESVAGAIQDAFPYVVPSAP